MDYKRCDKLNGLFSSSNGYSHGSISRPSRQDVLTKYDMFGCELYMCQPTAHSQLSQTFPTDFGGPSKSDEYHLGRIRSALRVAGTTFGLVALLGCRNARVTASNASATKLATIRKRHCSLRLDRR